MGKQLLKFMLALVLLSASVSNINAQEPMCLLGPTEITVNQGVTVTFNWVIDNPTPNLLYVRIRRAQSSSGSYGVWQTLPPTQRSYTFTVSSKQDYHYFVTAWYNINGVVVESAGSNHVKVTVP